MIPGLEHAEFVRYGVMHRNSYINSPELLLPTLQLRKQPNLLFAGQLTASKATWNRQPWAFWPVSMQPASCKGKTA